LPQKFEWLFKELSTLRKMSSKSFTPDKMQCKVSSGNEFWTDSDLNYCRKCSG